MKSEDWIWVVLLVGVALIGIALATGAGDPPLNQQGVTVWKP